MNASKLLGLILAIGLAAGVYHLLTRKKPAQPPNERVNERSFDQLRFQMTEAQIEGVLGLPHRTSGGDVVKLERPDSSELRCTIKEENRVAGGSVRNVYLGRNEESIVVLFSAGTVTAAEYRVSDYPVLYRGPQTAARSQPVSVLSSSRSAGPAALQEREKNVAQFQRRRAIEKHSANLFYGSTNRSSATEAGSASPASASGQASGQLANAVRPGSQAAASVDSSAGQPPSGRSVVPASTIAGSVAGSRANALKIPLPSGRVLTESSPPFELPKQWQDKFFPKGITVFVARRSDGATESVSAVHGAKMHGPSATLNESGRLERLAFYADAKLHGAVRAWTEQDEPLLYAEHSNGRKEGLVCLFRAGAPWLVQEWRRARLDQEYLVGYVDSVPTALAVSDLAEEEAMEYARAREQLEELEGKMQRDEKTLSGEIVSRFRREERRTKGSKTAPPASARQKPAGVDREAARLQKLETEWRDALNEAR